MEAAAEPEQSTTSGAGHKCGERTIVWRRFSTLDSSLPTVVLWRSENQQEWISAPWTAFIIWGQLAGGDFSTKDSSLVCDSDKQDFSTLDSSSPLRMQIPASFREDFITDSSMSSTADIFSTGQLLTVAHADSSLV
ncbi:hypothetical protein WMY93_018398 [Mugilogobius chulae]|uniref:Uncharacterized protein n=1 Tax=Mugilogobius chulae TaxID=88201 RepID=A0AAW0NVZ7_9GOBI